MRSVKIKVILFPTFQLAYKKLSAFKGIVRPATILESFKWHKLWRIIGIMNIILIPLLEVIQCGGDDVS